VCACFFPDVFALFMVFLAVCGAHDVTVFAPVNAGLVFFLIYFLVVTYNAVVNLLNFS
jgi:hypothetical protein